MIQLSKDDVPNTLRQMLNDLPANVEWGLWSMNVNLRVVALSSKIGDREVAAQMVWDVRETDVVEHPCALQVRLATAIRLLEGRLAQYVT